MKETILALMAGFTMLIPLSLLQAASNPAIAVDDDDLEEALVRPEVGMLGSSLTVLPEDGRDLFMQAFDGAKRAIRIEICVLGDPQILERLQAALRRGTRVRVIVKYADLASERANLAQFVTAEGGELHLSQAQFESDYHTRTRKF